MFSFVVRRVLFAVPTIFVIIVLTFVLMHAAPGGPFDDLPDLDPEVLNNLRAAYHLDDPIWQQFVHYLSNLLRGDLGPSLVYRELTVNQIIATGLPVSITVGLSAMAIGLSIGLLCGIIAALRQNTAVDYAVMAAAMTGVAVPTFVTAPLLILVFGLYLAWLPISGWNGGQIQNLILPVTTLAIPKVAAIARITRGAMLEALHMDFVRTARAKGMPEHKVILRHVLRPVFIPVVSYLGPAIATVMTGSVIIEKIFGLPGIGRAFVDSAIDRDYPVVMGIVIVYAVFIVMLNLVADVLYGFLDPRIRQK